MPAECAVSQNRAVVKSAIYPARYATCDFVIITRACIICPCPRGEVLPRDFFGNFHVGAKHQPARLFLAIALPISGVFQRETTVSTKTSAPFARAWIPAQNAFDRRAQRDQSAPRQGPRAADRRRQTRQSVSQTVGNERCFVSFVGNVAANVPYTGRTFRIPG